MDNGTDPVADDELLYRRIPTSTGWYDPDTGLKPEAFAPHKTEDVTGLSVYRSKYTSIEKAARGRQGKSYYVAVLRAGALRQLGIEIVPRPDADDPGHAEMPALNSANRKLDKTLELERTLSELCVRIDGPFSS